MPGSNAAAAAAAAAVVAVNNDHEDAINAADANAASAPSILDVMRSQRRRGGPRVCLFGAPEPNATHALYDQMLGQQHQYMLNRYGFDMKAARYVGADAELRESTSLAEHSNSAATETATAGASEPVDHLQERLHDDEHNRASSASASEAGASLQQVAHASATETTTTTTMAAAAAVIASAGVNIDASSAAADASAGGSGARVKTTKSSASLRHNAKPYDKPPPSMRPITGK